MTKKYNVGTSLIRILSDEDSPKTIEDVVFEAVIGNTDITRDYLMLDQANMTYQAEKFYEYGRDSFTYGLPKGIFVSAEYKSHSPANNDDIKLVIEAIEGETITIVEWDIISTPDPITSAYMYMYNYLGYDPLTNTCMAQLVDASLDSGAVVTFDDADFILSEGLTITFDIVPDPQIPDTTVKVSYDYITRGYILNTPLYKIKYTKVGSLATYWWTYCPLVGEHPSLGSTVDSQAERNYFPFAPIRINTHNITDDSRALTPGEQTPVELRKSELNNTTRSLFNKLNINLDEITDSVMSNENVDKISDAYVTFAVPINASSDAQLLYLYEFFKDEIQYQTYNKVEFDDWYAGDHSGNVRVSYIYIYDQRDQQSSNVRQQIMYHYIDEVTEVGVIGNVGYIDSTLDGGEYVGTKTVYIDTSTVVIRQQITTSTYSVITIMGINERTIINIDDAAIGSRTGKSLSRRTTIREVLANEIGSHGLFIPMSYIVVTNDVFTAPNMTATLNNLYHESLMLLINSVEVTVLEWYETSEFAQLIKIIGIVVAVVTWSPYISALIAASSWAAAAWILAELAIRYILMLLAAKVMLWVVEKIGGKYALILAAVIAIAAAVVGITGIDIGMYMPSAETMLQAVNAITSAVTEYAYDEMVELQQEAEDFLKSAEEKQEELDAAEDLLFSDIDYDLLNIIVNPPVILDESPEQFFNRTIHIGNPGVLSLNAPNDFVSNLLTLPDNLIT